MPSTLWDDMLTSLQRREILKLTVGNSSRLGVLEPLEFAAGFFLHKWDELPSWIQKEINNSWEFQNVRSIERSSTERERRGSR